MMTIDCGRRRRKMCHPRPAGPALACLLTSVMLASAAEATEVKILSWNIYTYNQPGTDEHEALVRIVQALDPDILLFQEANHEPGRNAFAATFQSRYPYSFLGSPSNEYPKNQILSAFPIIADGEIFCEKGDGSGTFERPTIWAELDLDDPADGVADLRVYSVHYKSGFTSDDNLTRINQALEDDGDVMDHLTSNPDARIYYAGDLNGQLGETPITIIQAHLTRLPIVDPNNGSPATRPVSGRVIDHVLYSSSLSGKISDAYIFNTTTFVPPAAPPAPAQADDSDLASDHLSLIATVDVTTSGAGSSPVVTSAVSWKTHVNAGPPPEAPTDLDFGINVLDRTAGLDIESRNNGVTKLVVGFNMAVQGVDGLGTEDVSINHGSVDAVSLSASPADTLTIEMSDTLVYVLDQGVNKSKPLRVTFPGIANASDASAVCTDEICIRQLVGDTRVDGGSGGAQEGKVNLFDLLAMRDHIDQQPTSATARLDVRYDDAIGVINLFDMLDTRDRIDTVFDDADLCP